MNVNRRDRILKPLASFVLRPVTGNPFFFFSREREKGEAEDIWHLRTEIFGQGCSLIFFQRRSKWLLHLCFETTRPNFNKGESIYIYEMYIKFDENIRSWFFFFCKCWNCKKRYFFNFQRTCQRVFFIYFIYIYLRYREITRDFTRDGDWIRRKHMDWPTFPLVNNYQIRVHVVNHLFSFFIPAISATRSTFVLFASPPAINSTG